MAEGAGDLALFSAGRRQKRKPGKAAPREHAKARKCTTDSPQQPGNDDETSAAREESNGRASTSAPASFRSLGLGEHLQRTCASLGMTVPTPVQVRTTFTRLPALNQCIACPKRRAIPMERPLPTQFVAYRWR